MAGVVTDGRVQPKVGAGPRRCEGRRPEGNPEPHAQAALDCVVASLLAMTHSVARTAVPWLDDKSLNSHLKFGRIGCFLGWRVGAESAKPLSRHQAAQVFSWPITTIRLRGVKTP